MIKVLKQPQDVTWEELLQIIDIVGMWHYSRSKFNKKDWNITNPKKNYIVLYCFTTQTYFKFSKDWKVLFRHTDEKGKHKDKLMVEAQLYSAFEFVNTLLSIKAITIE